RQKLMRRYSGVDTGYSCLSVTKRRDVAWALLMAHRVRREKLAGLVVVDLDPSERRVLYLWHWFHLMKSKICLRFTPCLEERSSYCERNHAPALCRLPQGLAVWDSARGPHAAPSRRPPPLLGGLRCAGQPAWGACARPPTVVCEREGRLPADGPGSLGGPEAVGGRLGRSRRVRGRPLGAARRPWCALG